MLHTSVFLCDPEVKRQLFQAEPWSHHMMTAEIGAISTAKSLNPLCRRKRVKKIDKRII